MSMHNASEASFERINKSIASEPEDEEEIKKGKKRCITIVIIVCVLLAAVLALILVLVLGKSSGEFSKGYNPYTISDDKDGLWYYQAILKRTQNISYPVPVDNITNPEFDDLKMRVSMMNDHTFRVRINPIKPGQNLTAEEIEEIKRWEVPDTLLGNMDDNYGMRLEWANFKPSKSPSGFKMSNPMGSKVNYLSTINRNFVFSDKYLEMGFLLDSQTIFGFGQRHRTFELNPGNYSSWTDGRENIHDVGSLGNNLYGDHPFVLAKLKDNSFIGIFFKNSNAKALEYLHGESNSQSVLNFRAIGGIMDFFIFVAEKPEDVIKAYHNVIGKPFFPPFWALGYHQSSPTYDDIKKIDHVLEAHDLANIPLESIWLDVQYMKDVRNFEVDKARFKSIPTLAQALHRKQQRLVTVVESGLAADDAYSYYKQADQQNLLIKSVQHTGDFNGNLIGESLPGKCAYVDFFKPQSTDYWVNALKGLYTETSTDGIWLARNEIMSFCDGECPTGNSTNLKTSNSSIPFNPLGDSRPLETNTLSLDGQHFAETKEDKVLNVEYNMHSLYGIMQSKATQQFWNDETPVQSKRPFIISRSTFAGSGKYTAHWLGDNHSQWSDMQLSISGIMNFNLFGIPLVGADVCGYAGKHNDEMCARWIQLSAFYPFARNNYNVTEDVNATDTTQEAYNLKAPYNETARLAVNQRYSFLRYYYTKMYEISKHDGGTLVRPLFFEFPQDSGAYHGYEHSFMVGEALKVTPILSPESEHQGKVNSYFPKNTRFISLNDFHSIVDQGTSGANVTLTPSLDHALVHMKEGTIIPYQNTSDYYFSRTYNLINDRGLDILVFPDTNGNAEGTLYIDRDGEDEFAIENNKFEYYKLRFSNRTLKINLMDGKGAEGDIEGGNHIIKDVYILGVGKLTLSNETACAFSTEMVPEEIMITYDEEREFIKLNVTNSGSITFNEFAAIQYTVNADDVSYCRPKYTVASITPRSANANTTTTMEVKVKSGTNLPDLDFTFILVKDNMVRVMINNPDSPNSFKVTDEVFNPDYLPLDGHDALENIQDYLFIPGVGEEFYYQIHEFKNPKNILYSTKGQPFVYTKNFMKTSALINSNGRIFGMGERVGDFLLKEGVYTIWARDEPSPVENGRRPGSNIYGSHPVYFTQMSSSSEFFAVFDNNAGAQDFIIQSEGNNMRITHIKTSGSTDMIIVLNDHIQTVTSEFINLIGRPTLVPEWALGWHQCRWGYNNSEQVKGVVDQYLANNIPLDAMWTDIDYMDMYRDFTLSSTNFGELPGYISTWRNNYGIRYVPILDAAIAYEPSNKKSSYARGKKKGIFIKDPNDNSKPFIGKVWPGSAVYIDWLKKEAEDYWVNEMSELHEMLPFDGMWIDMNEAANFCNGYCTTDQRVENSVQNNLFYVPGARDLNYKSISIDAKHEDGTLEFEAHSLYGFYMSKATSKYFTEKAKTRPFVLSRSTYTGVGKFGSHWLGDNFSTYEMMKYSVGGIYLFGTLGVPVVGADICGFLGNTNPDLCARWYALGAFYPFSRNHNDQSSHPQEPYVDMFMKNKILGTNMTYTDFIREASLKRYALHRYQYTELHKASFESTVYFKPLFYNYPEDKETFNNAENNILLGDSVKLSPILDFDKTFTFYFPEKGATWCPIWPKHQKGCWSGQSKQKVSVPLDEILVHIKSGTIIPLQLENLKNVPQNINLAHLRDSEIDIAVLCDSKYSAKGEVRYDDGETTDLTKFSEFEFRAQGSSPFIGSAYLDIYVQIDTDDSDDKTSKNQELGSVIIYNASQFKLTSKSSAVVTFLDDTSHQLEANCSSSDNICRFNKEDGETLVIRNIKSIHIQSS